MATSRPSTSSPRSTLNLHLFTLILTLILPLCDAQSPTFLHSVFRKVPFHGSFLKLYGTEYNIPSVEACASICADKRTTDDKPCLAILYDALGKKCTSLITKGEIPVTTFDPEHVYSVVALDKFHSFVTTSGRVYSILITSSIMTYEDGRSYCNDLGGFLFEFDTLEKYPIMKALTGGSGKRYFFVGANDQAVEGSWVTDRERLPLNTTLWIWRSGNPGQHITEEDGAAVDSHVNKIVDLPNTAEHNVVCEKMG